MTDTNVNELWVTEHPDSYFWDVSEIVASLDDDSVTEIVRFDGEFLCGLPEIDQAALLLKVSQLKQLQEIHFGDASIQVSVLSKVIETAQDLKVFSLSRVVLEGTPDDFINFEFSIRNHASLTQLVWEDFNFCIVDSQEEVKLDGIIQALSMLETLKVVKLRPLKGINNVSFDDSLCLTALLQSLSLRELHLSHLQLDKMAFALISSAIKTTPMQINVLALIDCAVDDDACVEIAAAISQNKSLERLDLSSNNVGDAGCASLGDGLVHNTVLKRLALADNKRIGIKGYESLARMLLQNYSLGCLETPIGATHDCRQIRQYLNSTTTRTSTANSNHAIPA
jgi:hypothetical protein